MAQLTDRDFAHVLGLPVNNVINSQVNLVPPAVLQGNQFQARSALPNIAGTTTTGDTAYAVYVGKTQRKITAQKVIFHVSTAGTSTQVGEVGIFYSDSAPNGAAQTLTKIVADGTLDDLTGTGVKGNTTAFSRDIEAGKHLWALYRVNMAGTEPTVWGLTADMSQGQVLALTGASALTGVSTVAGALIAAAVAWQAPSLVLTYT